MLANWQSLSLEVIQRTMLHGLIHDDSLANQLIERDLSLNAALAKVPSLKREWLAHIGLFPYDAAAPMVMAVEALTERPAAFRDAVAMALQELWTAAFATTWEYLLPALRTSLAEKRRLLLAAGLSAFAREALLRIDVDEDNGLIRAARGGYELRFSEIRAAVVLPSAFNDKRYWSAYEQTTGTLVYFPYFDPSLSPELAGPGMVSVASSSAAVREPELDAALVFKALGDTTRFALAMILAQEPCSAADLARRLDVSKPTITHHLQAFRLAGLVLDDGGRLMLRRDVIERLSAAAAQQLYHKRIPRNPKTTRSKQ